MSSILHPHLNSRYVPITSLVAASTVIAEHRGKIATVLAGGFDTDKKQRARKHELDGLTIAAALDVRKLATDQERMAFYSVYQNAFSSFYRQDQSRIKKAKIEDRPSLVHLRKALAIGKDGTPLDSVGEVSQAFYDAWQTGLGEHISIGAR